MRKVPEYADLIGKPYKLMGRGPSEYDCYGLMQALYKRVDIIVPDYMRPEHLAAAHEIVDSGKLEWERCDEEPMSVAVIRLLQPVGDGHIRAQNCHVAMVLPFGKMIHVWERSGGVCVEPIDMWRRRITGFYRYKQ